ncbi:MAG: TCP-1/cpn60 chaperonin family protein [Acetobacteraceae bacterium]|nr:TCP-1/cpn60 chaperonin family protein [Acetobacteraceae bacterium]
MTLKQVASGSEIDERLAALITNANAVRAIASAVEGTIGSKGLDSMLVDRFGEVVITNDGITILTKMEVNHPAAKMVINTARAQEDEVGDGTTTATIMAGSLLTEGVNQAIKGVPVTRIIEGVRVGVSRAVELIKERSRPVSGVDDPVLRRVALIAGRGHEDIADLVTEAAALIGSEKLLDPSFKLADTVVAEESAQNEVFMGLIISQQRMNQQMPKELEPVTVLVVDDALEPEEVEEEALSTEAGFQRSLELQEEFKDNLRRAVALGVNLILVDRGVSDAAEEILTDAGVMVLQRVASKELRRVAEHTGARPIKRTGLKKEPADLEKCLGRAERAVEDERLEHVRLLGGKGKPLATILVGAATAEVVDERERIARDAASAVQAAVRGGVVPGGGAVEVAVAREIEKLRESIRGMAAYGVGCVSEALKRPLAQIVANAGFNPLEKLGDVIAAQAERGMDSLAIDCETGEVADMLASGVVDPTLVKTYALKAAGEIAEAILRIDTIIKKKDEASEGSKPPAPDSGGPEEMDF